MTLLNFDMNSEKEKIASFFLLNVIECKILLLMYNFLERIVRFVKSLLFLLHPLLGTVGLNDFK